MPRGMVATLVLVLALVACVGRTDEAEPPAPSAAAPPVEREYWPTDGWRTADPAAHGVDAEALADLDRVVAGSYPGIRSVLVVRHGYLVHEHYRDGLDASDGHDVRSITKSVVSALVGIALADGAIASLDQTIRHLLADHLSPDVDSRLADVRLRHLLAMTSGLPGDEPGLRGEAGLLDRLMGSPDYLRAILGLELVAAPGDRWAYSSASSDLLAAVVADATGRPLLDLARDRLFGPLDIEAVDAYEPVIARGRPTPEQVAEFDAAPVAWLKHAQGYHWGGAGLRLPARDLAKIGFLYLNRGEWDGAQVVPAEYVQESTAAGGVPAPAGGYGWQWWVDDVGDHSAVSARGRGGQIIEVVPELDLVVVITADADSERGDGHTIVESFIAPAVED